MRRPRLVQRLPSCFSSKRFAPIAAGFLFEASEYTTDSEMSYDLK
jgi:hypothetical protein